MTIFYTIFYNQIKMLIRTFERCVLVREIRWWHIRPNGGNSFVCALVVNRVTLISPLKKQQYPHIVRKIGSLLRNSPRNSTAIFSTKHSTDCNALSRYSTCLVLTSRRGFLRLFLSSQSYGICRAWNIGWM